MQNLISQRSGFIEAPKRRPSTVVFVSTYGGIEIRESIQEVWRKSGVCFMRDLAEINVSGEFALSD